MRGLIFTEFLDCVEQKYGIQIVEDMIQDAVPPSGGAYVAVDTYPLDEFMSLVSSLSTLVALDPDYLVREFGELLFGSLSTTYGHLLVGLESPFELLDRLDAYIHFEVQKLYPDAELPSFVYEQNGQDCGLLLYQSDRGLASLAHGLLMGCFEHYDSDVSITIEDQSEGAGTRVAFQIQRVPRV